MMIKETSKNSLYPSLLEEGKACLPDRQGLRSDDSYSRVRLVGAIKKRVFRGLLNSKFNPDGTVRTDLKYNK
jgi:hypothetical protein